MNARSPLLSLFKEQFENESTRIASEHGLNQRGDQLIWWYFLRLAGLTSTEIEEVVCDGGNDLGIDAIHIDDNGLVHFYQFKNPQRADVTLPAGEVDKLLAGLQVILNRRHSDIANPELRERIEDIYQIVPTGYRIHLVTSGIGMAQESRVKLDAFLGSLGGPTEDFFTWQLEDLEVLQDTFYQRKLPTVERPIVFTLERQPPYQIRSANHDCYLFHATGVALSALYAEHSEQLLQQNIRVFQGDRTTNALIRQTASSSDSANFFHYNNGVTFLCETAQWDQFQGKLTLNKAQVVNGGQTVRVLSRAQTDGVLKADVVVPVRVITSQGDKQFASDVAVNLNNQNRIESSFLRSNEPRVVQLAHAMESVGWYLERRENEVRNLSDQEKRAIELRIGHTLDGRVVRMRDGAQAYVATYMRQPELAKKNPRRIFLGTQDGGVFERVFSNDISAERFIAAHRLRRAADSFVGKFMILKRRKSRVADWRAEYKALLGDDIVGQHGATLDQAVPQRLSRNLTEGGVYALVMKRQRY
ncbi:MAG: AIPR family protein, partial [Gemmatimonadetes bacterium]|nr:AIPR family protein [Gemmatimonadota bacterium]